MKTGSRGLALVGLGLLIAGCAATQNTLAQDLAWERAEKCKTTANIQIVRVDPDGQIWYQYSSGGASVFNECLKKAAADQARRGVVAAPPPAVASSATAVILKDTSAAIPMPRWKVGDEWAYRQESPDSVLTFVWSVEGMGNLDGVEHYVVKSGPRKFYYRAADGAVTLETVSGKEVRRYTPSWVMVDWPLSAGKKWETRYSDERVADRIAEDVVRSCEVGADQMLTVPAGTFTTMPITCRNARTGVIVYQQWYAPQVKHFVREVWGTRIRELINYRLR